MVLVGDAEGKTAVLVDDIADTCGTLAKAAEVLMAHKAKEVLAIVTHGKFCNLPVPDISPTPWGLSPAARLPGCQ
jgi:phosphoribosylpyrophosphate synthetase